MSGAELRAAFKEIERGLRKSVKRMLAAFDYKEEAGLSLSPKQALFRKVALFMFPEYAGDRPVERPSPSECLEYVNLVRTKNIDLN
jgi:hypothetical protein